METEIIEITRGDLWQYYKTLSNTCKIRLVKSKIYSLMSKDLKAEFKCKFNDLVEIETGMFGIIALESSEILKDFLAKFKFKLIDYAEVNSEVM